MVRNFPGQEVRFQLNLLVDGKPFTGVAEIWVKRRGVPVHEGQGQQEHLRKGFFCYYPTAEETDSESVSFQAGADGVGYVQVQFEPQPGTLTVPPSLHGRERISRIEFLETVSGETVQPSMVEWVSALMLNDPIPLTPGIMNGLCRSYPRIFKLTEE